MAKKGGRRPTFKEITEKLKVESQNESAPAKPFNITLTETASKVYFDLEERNRSAIQGNDPSNQNCTTFRMVDDAIRKIIPSDPLNPKYALHEPLANMYRIAKGRLRIVWIVEQEYREILILYISDTLRKEGDKRDPYAILNAMAKAGYLTQIIEDWRKALDVPPDARIN